jgi:hypothetical protein
MCEPTKPNFIAHLSEVHDEPSYPFKSPHKSIVGLTTEMEQQLKKENSFFVDQLNDMNAQLKYVVA